MVDNTYVQSPGYGSRAVNVGLATRVGHNVMLVTLEVVVYGKMSSVAVAVVGLGVAVVDVSVRYSVLNNQYFRISYRSNKTNRSQNSCRDDCLENSNWLRRCVEVRGSGRSRERYIFCDIEEHCWHRLTSIAKCVIYGRRSCEEWRWPCW